ncbi:MAG: class I SAM-dependent methyltransferase [Candidatus Methylumidiphilus sp.]
MAKKDDLLKQVELSRRKFARSIADLNKAGVKFLDRAPVLPQYLLENCKVFSGRDTMLDSGIFNGGVWAEVGVDQGKFSKEIIVRAKPSRLHLIEIDTSKIDRSIIGEYIESGIATIHAGNSPTVLMSFPENFFDVVYIDGNHLYQGVKADIAAASNRIKPGGAMIFNDYAAWSPVSMSRCGVAKAVNEFINEMGWNVIALALQGTGYHDLAIRKPRYAVTI